MTDLPPGWEWATFGDVASVDARLVDPSNYQDLPHVAPNHIESQTGRLLPYRTVREDGVTSGKYLFRAGQILYSKIRPYLAKAVRADFEGLCSADMYPISTALNPRYLHQWMLSSQFTALAAQHQGRSVLPKINRADLSKLPVPVPPLNEQGRIVAAIEEHFSRLDAALSAVAGGKAKLLSVEKAYEFGLADSARWRWTTLGEIAEVRGGVTKDAKRQSDPTYVEVPYLRVANVQRGYLDLSRVTTIRVPPEKAKQLLLQPGDVLFNEGGDRDKLGRGWVWEGQIEDCIHQNHVFRARLTTGDFDPYFLSHHANTWGQQWFERNGRQTTNLASIGMETLKQLPIPAPPRSVQERMVTKLSSFRTEVSRMSTAATAVQQRSKGLRHSTLSAAFSGQLVPQHPANDPASVLLERIRAERAAAEPTRRRKKVNS